MSEGIQIVRALCHQVNCIPSGRSAMQAKCGRCGHPLFDGYPAQVNDAGLLKQMERSDISVVVDFWAQWCGPRRSMAPAFEQVAAAMEPAVRFVKVDVDQNKEVAGKLGVQSIPALFIMRGGKMIGRQTGAMSAGELGDWVKRATGLA